MKKETDIKAVTPKSSQSSDALPKLVAQVRDNSISILLPHIDSLFTTCDDLFFDLSSRAASNSEQNLYFESMRELRVRKSGVIDSFKRSIEQHFVDIISPNPTSKQTTRVSSVEQLSLVQEDEIEQKVAINSMTRKARVTNQEPLYQLATRLDYLTLGNLVTEDNNPIDPQQLCHSFATSCEQLDINIKAKIILYKQFDRLVISRLANIYSNANDLLINAGVIPKFSRSIKNPEQDSDIKDNDANSAPTTEDSQPFFHQEQASISNFDFYEFSQLLDTIRQLGMHLIPNYQTYSRNPGPMMSNEELLTALTLLQAQQTNKQDNDTQIAAGIREAIDTALTQANPEKPQAVKKSDEDVINLVAMFFDFVLDDNNLPPAFQALIGRLQIPILKLALKDQSFFNNAKHPARKLVNTLASSSVGWDDIETPEKDKTYIKISTIIHEILESGETNETIYALKLSDLESFISRNEHRRALIERRTKQAAEGHARTAEAKEATQKHLLSQLENSHLPDTIYDFLINTWQQLLIMIHLKKGEESPEWIDATQLVQDLVWVCQPQTGEKSKQRFEKIRADLFTRIDNGLTEIISSDQECNEMVASVSESLDNLHKQYNESAEKPDLQSLTEEYAKQLGVKDNPEKSWQEMSALERQQARHKALTYEYIKKADSLPLNTWIKYEDKREGRILRCKFAGKIDSSDSYIFVNRFGFKVMEKSRKDFAYDMQQKNAVVLETSPLFDRAMSTITNNLKQLSTNQAITE